MSGHSFKADHPAARFIGRAVCGNCGLVRLKNLLTEWCVARGCDFREHPGFAEACRTLPSIHRSGKAEVSR
jgi:hypothetical protein